MNNFPDYNTTFDNLYLVRSVSCTEYESKKGKRKPQEYYVDYYCINPDMGQEELKVRIYGFHTRLQGSWPLSRVIFTDLRVTPVTYKGRKYLRAWASAICLA